MPASYTYPGVYLQEIPSGVRTIAGVSTSDTAFLDVFARGPIDRAVRITSLDDFERRFGGLDRRSEGSYAIRQYYANGGSIAWVVRVVADEAAAAELARDAEGGPAGAPVLTIAAADPGAWGNALQVGIDFTGTDRDDADNPIAFNLFIREVRDGRVVQSEVHRNVNTRADNARRVATVVNAASSLVRVTVNQDDGLPAATHADLFGQQVDQAAFVALAGGEDGPMPDAQGVVDGLAHLDRIAPAVFNLMCVPIATTYDANGYETIVDAATTFCQARRAFLLVDPRLGDTYAGLPGWLADYDTLRSDHSAMFFPRLAVRDPLDGNRPRLSGPSGTMAGVFARTDAQRGVWKAPAGTEASLRGADSLAERLTDLENGFLNVNGVNVLRSFPVYGMVAWGSRTLHGADARGSEYKYIPVRRTALYIEESLYQGLKWVVFEPNDEPLWAQIRLNVGAFMNTLFRQGAFQGTTARDAYFVRCDRETTTQNDIDRGIVNIIVGFAPLKPAEFVVIKLQQIAGQLAT
ncbi:MAG: phage tail sheath subtilisin-like domain-containing protein [Gemmatimonadaceae bacterium]|nr:phage tail sheath subtilisin-like domain-containing protein [Gemmatimonadaceae bacterium]